MTTDSPEFAPCPFCGGDARTVPPTARATDPYDPSDRLFPEARCKRCHATALGENGDFSCKTAIAAWNRRPDRSPAGEVLTAAHKALGAALDALQDYADTHPTYRQIADARDALAALSPAPAPEREGLLEEALRDLSAESECRCIHQSREREIEYETGRCPHQRARAALAAYEEGRK